MTQAQVITHTPGDVMRPWMVYLAYAILAYPIIPLSALYGEWGLAWFHLGHQPIPSANDPQFIEGSNWVRPVSVVASFGLFPIAIAAILVFIPFITRAHKYWTLQVLELLAIPSLWAGTVALLLFDPGRVIEWWLD